MEIKLEKINTIVHQLGNLASSGLHSFVKIVKRFCSDRIFVHFFLNQHIPAGRKKQCIALCNTGREALEYFETHTIKMFVPICIQEKAFDMNDWPELWENPTLGNIQNPWQYYVVRYVINIIFILYTVFVCFSFSNVSTIFIIFILLWASQLQSFMPAITSLFIKITSGQWEHLSIETNKNPLKSR